MGDSLTMVLPAASTELDDEALAGLFDRHQQRLYRLALRMSGDREAAADLVQETFLRAWRSFDKLREQKAAKSWLITILRREFARGFERKVPDLVTLDGLDLPDVGGIKPEGDSELRLLRQAMLELEPKYREPILLQVIGGFSCEEIATELNVSRSAVMTQLFRARQKLKDALATEEEK